MKPFRVALCQITPGLSRDGNVQHALAMASEAVANGAELLLFPEMFYYPYDLAMLPRICGGETEILDEFKTLAADLRVSICTGSMVWEEGGRRYNRSHLIDSTGCVQHSYSKCHLFDVALDDVSSRESAVFTAGDDVSTVETEFGRIGILICYDIRFPEMAREIALQGADLLIVPAVFSKSTGQAHWHHFMQTRATENQLFLAAVSTGRDKAEGRPYYAYGHSMVVSPWGEILAEAGEDEEIIYCDINPECIVSTRKKFPLLQHRRGKLYTSFSR